MFDDNRKIGIGLTAFGALFMFLGVILFFDWGLLTLGNVLFISGTVLIMGIQNTSAFFFRKNKLRGTISFAIGFSLVIAGWPVIGMMVEFFGILNLFGNFFPVAIAFLRSMPVIGNILNLPVLRSLMDRVQGNILPIYAERSE